MSTTALNNVVDADYYSFDVMYKAYGKGDGIKRLLESFMMPSCLFGGIFAILIATDSSRNGYWVISLQYFGYHAAITIFALKLMSCKELKWDIKDYLNCLSLLFVFGLVSIYLNSILNDGKSVVNFMYTVAPPQEGLPYLNKNNVNKKCYILNHLAVHSNKRAMDLLKEI